MTLKPLIVVCGTTGVGKSRLAIELALSLQKSSKLQRNAAKIINADAMQVYEGLNVITNKVTAEEQQGVEHLLMSFKRPGEQYVVGEWVKDASSAIDRMHAAGQMPIVVGGTSYWIHHLLFQNTLPATQGPSSHKRTEPKSGSELLASRFRSLPDELQLLFRTLPTDPPSAKTDADGAFALHSLLSGLDPEMAARWHWKDTRKVLRNLEIIQENGCTATEAVTSAAKVKSSLRYNALIFWLYAKPDILNPRLDERVDDMLKKGLMDEIRDLRALKAAKPSPSSKEDIPSTREMRPPSPSANEDFTLGIYQAIGYKEFNRYLSSPEHSDKIFADGLEEMKRSTRKYAQRQIKWIRNKLLPAIEAARVEAGPGEDSENRRAYVFLLDATDIGPRWETNVLDTAINLLQAFLSDIPLPSPTSLSSTAREVLTVPDKPMSPGEVLTARRKLTCPVCTMDPARPIMIEYGQEWEAHQRTRVHRRLAKKAGRGLEQWHNVKRDEESGVGGRGEGHEKAGV